MHSSLWPHVRRLVDGRTDTVGLWVIEEGSKAQARRGNHLEAAELLHQLCLAHPADSRVPRWLWAMSWQYTHAGYAGTSMEILNYLARHHPSSPVGHEAQDTLQRAEANLCWFNRVQLGRNRLPAHWLELHSARAPFR